MFEAFFKHLVICEFLFMAKNWHNAKPTGNSCVCWGVACSSVSIIRRWASSLGKENQMASLWIFSLGSVSFFGEVSLMLLPGTYIFRHSYSGSWDRKGAQKTDFSPRCLGFSLAPGSSSAMPVVTWFWRFLFFKEYILIFLKGMEQE